MRKLGSIWMSMAKMVLFFAVMAVLFIGQNIFYEETVFYFWGNYVNLLIYAAVLYFTCRIYGSFLFGRAEYQEIAISWVLCLIITNILEYFQLSLLSNRLLPVAGFLIIFAVQLVFIIPFTLFINKLYYIINPADKAIIIYGEKEKADKYRRVLQSHRKKFKVEYILSQDESEEKLQRHIDEAESVFFIGVDEGRKEHLFGYCFRYNKRIYIQPTFNGVLLNTAEVSWASNVPMFSPKTPKLGVGTRFVKRCFDIFISLLMVVITGWLMGITWLAIRLYDRQPAIYKQTRVTVDGKHFTLFKFRSMRIDAEKDGVARLMVKNDDRVTPIGKIIRQLRIDELPQMFNILIGDMSIVGPRPERPELIARYEAEYPNFSFRTKVKAGLTGFAQIYGNYNTAPDEKLLLDIMYIERASIWQDVKLLMQTVKVLFLPSATEGTE
jgi:exopolysaccharide biosynthesis polyprenyl glycosylphosphotransferase